MLRYCGDPDEAIETVKKAVRHQRLYPPWMANSLAASYRDNGEIMSSISVANESLRLEPSNVDGHVLLCTDYSMSDSPEEASRIGQKVLRIDPSFSVGRYLEKQPYRESVASETISRALRQAGLPD